MEVKKSLCERPVREVEFAHVVRRKEGGIFRHGWKQWR